MNCVHITAVDKCTVCLRVEELEAENERLRLQVTDLFRLVEIYQQKVDA